MQDEGEQLVLNITDNSILFDLAKRDCSPVRPAKPVAEAAELRLHDDSALFGPAKRDRSLVAKPAGLADLERLSPIGYMIKQRLGERYVFPRIKLGVGEGDLTCLVDWESWEPRINATWNDGTASSSYTRVLAFFVQRVEVADEGYLELALLLDRYCSPFTPKSWPISDRAIDRLEEALQRLDVVSSPTTCSILLALRRRHRFVLELPSWESFVFHSVAAGAKGRDAFDLDLLYADTLWPRSTNTPEQSPRALSPSPYSPAKPSYAPSSPPSPAYAPTSPSYPWPASPKRK